MEKGMDLDILRAGITHTANQPYLEFRKRSSLLQFS